MSHKGEPGLNKIITSQPRHSLFSSVHVFCGSQPGLELGTCGLPVSGNGCLGSVAVIRERLVSTTTCRSPRHLTDPIRTTELVTVNFYDFGTKDRAGHQQSLPKTLTTLAAAPRKPPQRKAPSMNLKKRLKQLWQTVYLFRKPKVAGLNPVGRARFVNELSITQQRLDFLVWPFLCRWHNSGRSFWPKQPLPNECFRPKAVMHADC